LLYVTRVTIGVNAKDGMYKVTIGRETKKGVRVHRWKYDGS